MLLSHVLVDYLWYVVSKVSKYLDSKKIEAV